MLYGAGQSMAYLLGKTKNFILSGDELLCKCKLYHNIDCTVILLEHIVGTEMLLTSPGVKNYASLVHLLRLTYIQVL